MAARDRARGERPLIDYLKTWHTRPDSRGDFIANIVFYLPCRYSLFGCFRERVPPVWRLIVVVLLGTALSVAMELSQFYVAERVDDVRDTYANAIGTLLGGVAAMTLRSIRHEARRGLFKRDLFASLLLAAFVTARLYPYVPVIDMHKYWHAVHPLLSFTLPSPDELFLRTVAWAAIYYILSVMFDAQRACAAFCAVIALVFVGQLRSLIRNSGSARCSVPCSPWRPACLSCVRWRDRRGGWRRCSQWRS